MNTVKKQKNKANVLRQRYAAIKSSDPELYYLIRCEQKRQSDTLELIPSENIVSKAVLEAMGSVLTNKYSEGYPGARYYGGNECIDKIETLAIERAKKLFDVPYANVQPYSGSPANFAVCLAICNPGDTIMGLHLFDGGHLTHGWKKSVTGKLYNSIPYHVKENGEIDFTSLRNLITKHKPRLIWVGATAYTKAFPFKKIAKIADEVGAYLVADIAHIAGLVISGVHESPSPYAHVITTTTHKTLRGPRGGMIMVTDKGARKDPELANKINAAIIPGSQGGPHNHITAGIAVALKEADTPAFRKYGKKVVKNAQALASELIKRGLSLVGDCTENHLILVKVGKGRGPIVEIALDLAGITVNKNTIPNEPSTPFYPSGIRLGTPSVTTRGMGVTEMKKIGKWIAQIVNLVRDEKLPPGKSAKEKFLKNLKTKLETDTEIKQVRRQVKELCQKFPIRETFI